MFEQFLSGSSLEECYAAVGAVANRWLDLLDTRGADLTDEELLGYISEATTMSKALAEYEGESRSRRRSGRGGKGRGVVNTSPNYSPGGREVGRWRGKRGGGCKYQRKLNPAKGGEKEEGKEEGMKVLGAPSARPPAWLPFESKAGKPELPSLPPLRLLPCRPQVVRHLHR